MTPGARIQAAIECLEPILQGAPAEKVLTNWARKSRFAGSKDRAAVRDHVFDALRCRDSFAVRGGASYPLNLSDPNLARQILIGLVVAQARDVKSLFNGVGHAPAPLTVTEMTEIDETDERLDGIWDMPEWCARLLKLQYGASAKEIAASLQGRAPVDLRVNLSKTEIANAVQVLAADGVIAERCDIAISALRVKQNARRVKSSSAFSQGLIELQDAGSQALIDVLVETGALKDGMSVLDFCAGGGGKSLAMAARKSANYFAHDIDSARMGDIAKRAARAGASITCLAPRQIGEKGPFDLVLCDVPCSGSGAWRRNPGSKWAFTQDRQKELLAAQKEVLDKAKHMVIPGGYLAYATCSLFAQENEDQINAFIETAPEFRKTFEKSWTPIGGSDGFFLSILTKG